MELLIYLGLGVGAGITAGLFGVGGGVIIVPALVLAFSLQGVNNSVLTHLAVGTSLATIVVTSISSVRAHHQKQAVDWQLFWSMAPAIAVGVCIGVLGVGRLSGSALQILFGSFAILVALQMALALAPHSRGSLPGRAGLAASGGFIGAVSAMFGIGGGSLTVPFLNWCNVSMQRAVATSAACGLPIAVFGALTNIVSAWGHPQLPTWSTGFVYWPAVLGIVVTSAPCAKLGAHLAHAMPALHLKRIFAAFLMLMGLLMILRNL